MRRLFLLLTAVVVFDAPSAMAVATPTLVQRFSGPNTYSAGNILTNNPSIYTCRFPDATTAGNLIVIMTTAPSDSTGTVTDDGAAGGNTYTLVHSASNVFTADDTTNGQYFNIYYAANSVSARTITVSFNKASETFIGCHGMEFNNVAATTPLDQFATNFRSNATATCGALGTMTSGDLIVQGMFLSGGITGTGFTAGSGQANITWKKSTADRWDGMAMQWGVYGTTTGFTPQMTFTAANTAYVTACAAFKASASAQGGTKSGMQVNGILHLSSSSITASAGAGNNATVTFDMPVYGNEVVIALIGGANWFTAVTDSHSNTWNSNTEFTGTGGTSNVQFWWPSPGSTLDTAMTITVTNQATAKDSTLMIYDISGAPTSGTFYDSASLGTLNGNQTTNAATVTGASSTPSKANGIVIGMMGVDAGTVTSCTSQTVETFRNNNDNTTTPSNVDENNGWCHFYNTNTSTVTFTFGFLSATLPQGHWSSMAAAFEPPVTANIPQVFVIHP